LRKKKWKIKFNGKKLDIILSGFGSDIKKEDLDFGSIPVLNHFDISRENNNIKLSFTLKEDIKTLLKSGSLTFLTKDPHMLGIMFTKSYLNNLAIKTSQEKSSANKHNEQQEKIFKNNQKQTKRNKLSKDIKNKNNKGKSIELPFVKYEDILATNTKEQPHKSDNKSLTLKDKGKRSTKKEIPSPKEKVKEGFVLKKAGTTTKEKDFIKASEKGNNIELFKIIASLCAVLGIVIISLFSWKKLLLLRYRGNQNLIKLLGVHHFGSRQSIAIVQIEKEKFLVGITPENINLLTKLNMKNLENDQMKISEHDLPEEDSMSQKAVNILKERFGQLKRI